MSFTYKFLTSGNDNFLGQGSSLWVVGGLGNDTISTWDSGADTIDGGSGNDSLSGDSNDLLLGGAGADTLLGGTMHGGAGGDLYLFREAGSQSLASKVFETANGGIDSILLSVDAGTSFTLPEHVENLYFEGVYTDFGEDTPDLVALTFTGNTLNNKIYAGNWHDTVLGGAGHDTVWGGYGSDLLKGEDGNDSLMGQFGADTMLGGFGDDTMDGAADAGFAYADRMEGGDGNDTYIVGANDIVVEVENGGIDTVRTSLTSFTLGAHVENLSYTGTANSTFVGNALDNAIIVQQPVAGRASIRGGEGADTIRSSSGDDVLGGDDGNDSISGGGGADVIRGGTGVDRLDGDAGNDILLGDWGNDTLRGGEGNDILNGATDNDSLDGGIGVDSLYGSAGADTLDGGEGNDLLQGDQGADILYGSAGADSLLGGAGNDMLFGGTENDTLIGGAGADTMTGGAGQDFFQFLAISDSQGVTRDVITDFSQAENDVIFLSGFDADGAFGTQNSYAWVGNAPVGIKGQLWVETAGGNSTVFGDANGDNIADLRIFVQGATLTYDDFVL